MNSPGQHKTFNQANANLRPVSAVSNKQISDWLDQRLLADGILDINVKKEDFLDRLENENHIWQEFYSETVLNTIFLIDAFRMKLRYTEPQNYRMLFDPWYRSEFMPRVNAAKIPMLEDEFQNEPSESISPSVVFIGIILAIIIGIGVYFYTAYH